jgi:hypothetical protein
MPETLTLPTGETVTPEDAFLFEGYPYRFVPAEEGFVLSPLYWGDSPLDLHVESPDDLERRWGAESRGVLTDEEWVEWLADARGDDVFTAEELDALADELGVAGDEHGRERGLLDRVRELLGR